jgi:hypothetical protein
MKKPCRLEWNNSGSWKLLGKFDAAVEDSTAAIMDAAAALVEALNNRRSGRYSMATLRVSLEREHPTALMRYDSAEKGWRDAVTGEPV